MAVRREQVPPHLYQRYGIADVRPRWAVWAAVAGVLAVLLTLGAIARGIGPGEEVKLIAWQASEDGAALTWSVLRYDDQPVYCVLRAQDEDRFDVGFAVVKVRNTAARPVFSTTLRVRGELFTVDTPACSTDSARLIRPHFRPGVLSPAQQSPLFAPWQPISDWLGG